MSRSSRSSLALLLSAVFGCSPAGADDDDSGASVEELTPGPCLPDELEDDDSVLTSTQLALGVPDALTACPDDPDWFTTELVTGQTLTLDLAFTATEGNIDVRIYGAAPEPLAVGDSPGDDEHVEFVATDDDDVFIEVWLVTDAGAVDGNTYTLQTAVGAR